MPACAEAVEQLAGDCPDELRILKNMRSKDKFAVPLLKTISTLAPGLNITTFMDTCDRVIQDRVTKNNHQKAPVDNHQNSPAGREATRHKFVGVLVVAAVIGVVILNTIKRKRRRQQATSDLSLIHI